MVAEEGEEVSVENVENVEATAAIEEAEEAEILIVDLRVETHDHHLRKCKCLVREDLG